MSDSSSPPKEPPEGCQEILGYIIHLFDGSAWLTKTLSVTFEWSERGVWATEAEAKAAFAAVIKELAE